MVGVMCLGWMFVKCGRLEKLSSGLLVGVVILGEMLVMVGLVEKFGDKKSVWFNRWGCFFCF